MIFYLKAFLRLKQLYYIICAINYNTLIPILVKSWAIKINDKINIDEMTSVLELQQNNKYLWW